MKISGPVLGCSRFSRNQIVIFDVLESPSDVLHRLFFFLEMYFLLFVSNKKSTLQYNDRNT